MKARALNSAARVLALAGMAMTTISMSYVLLFLAPPRPPRRRRRARRARTATGSP
ncbi:hypothetical protein [Actinomycetospora chibensis]|uniref:Uncharacterized protein n=1 Tax=Actinomycetospora chibensis TaxID=663606 RepID=A0ABV9RIU4_9PSEU|nr:hypothetical protein [Actinomycetospora chibensis]MDD7924622.1 hypothetical protein [Actinomycetospora chibensis]